MKKKWISVCLVLLMLFPLSCASGHEEAFSETQPLVRDISQVENRITNAVSISEQLTSMTMGEVVYGKYKAPIRVISFSPLEEPKYEVLLVGGVHGNEPAGVEIMLHILETLAENPHKYEHINFDIVPLVNPWGWSHDLRFNQEGRDINRDFASFNSQESKIIKDFTEGREYDLIIDCHEHPGAAGFYLYQYANPDESVSREIIETVRNLGYPIEQDVSMVILKTDDGLINAPMWGMWFMSITRQLSLTNYLRMNNSTLVYTIETPTHLPWENRLIMQDKAVDILLNNLGN